MGEERISTGSEWTGRSAASSQRWYGGEPAGELMTGFRAGSVAVWRTYTQRLLTRLAASRAWRGGWRSRPGPGATTRRSQVRAARRKIVGTRGLDLAGHPLIKAREARTAGLPVPGTGFKYNGWQIA
jgi:hypothetical protein